MKKRNGVLSNSVPRTLAIFRKARGLAALAALVIPAATWADVTIGTLVQGPNPAAGNAYIGQSFTAPPGEEGITSLSLLLFRGETGVPNPTVRIYAYDPTSDFYGQFLGAPLFSENLSLPLIPPNTGEVFHCHTQSPSHPRQHLRFYPRFQHDLYRQ